VGKAVLGGQVFAGEFGAEVAEALAHQLQHALPVQLLRRPQSSLRIPKRHSLQSLLMCGCVLCCMWHVPQTARTSALSLPVI
jgi:hypothetical protein